MPKKPKYDGVIEAVRYAPDGKVAWARVHERRGPVFGDHVILSREELIERLKSGKKFVVGKRIRGMGNAFEAGASVSLAGSNGAAYLVAGQGGSTNGDHLPGVPQL